MKPVLLAPKAKKWIAEHIPFLLFLFLAVYVSTYMNLRTKDYVGFAQQVSELGAIDTYLITRWNTWTSRMLIELAESSLLNVLPLWHVLNLTASILAFYSLRAFASEKLGTLSGWLVLALLLCYPFSDMDSAGWYATLPNYLWPASCALFALLTCARSLGLVQRTQNHTIWTAQRIIAQVCMAYAVSMELLAAVLVPFLIVSIIYGIVRHRNVSILIGMAFIAFAGIVLALLCPGNSARLAQETQTWWPSFAEFGPIRKVLLGFETTVVAYLYDGRILMLVLSVALAVAIFCSTRRTTARVLSLIPPCLFLLLPELNRRGVAIWPWPLSLLSKPDLTDGIPKESTLLISIVLIGIMLWESFELYGHSWRFIGFLTIGGAGIATRIAMGLSPTLFASGPRTFLFLDFAMIALTLFLGADFVKHIPRKALNALVIALTVAATTVCVSTQSYIWNS